VPTTAATTTTTSSTQDELLWNDELEFSHSLLLDDMRNNSAWNHRWFICHQGGSEALGVKILHREAQYALHAVEADPFNESPWRYMIGLLKEHNNNNNSTGDGDGSDSVVEVLQKYDDKLQQMVDSYNNTPDLVADGGQCHYMVGAHIDILQMIASVETLQKAAGLAHSLATEHDLIRRKYWLYREEQLRKQASSAEISL
jgi:protein farnesyltransferase/geranylgeranyltransferase type-1 subunit alpha